MNTHIFKVIAVALLTLFAVSAFAASPAELFKAKKKAAMKLVGEITPQELMQMNKDKKEFLLIDVREKNEVIAGKIEAENIMHSPRGLVDIVAFKGAIKPDQHIIIYCKKGTRGILAAASLKELGFEKVHNLKGGIHGWMASGYPITNSLGSFKTVPYELTGCAE